MARSALDRLTESAELFSLSRQATLLVAFDWMEDQLRALHTPQKVNDGSGEQECSVCVDAGFPCETLRVLDKVYADYKEV